MKAMTPANEIPPAQRTAASGMLPIEQTKLSTAISGPTRTLWAVFRAGGASSRKTAWKRSPAAERQSDATGHPPTTPHAHGPAYPRTQVDKGRARARLRRARRRDDRSDARRPHI